VNVAAVRAGQLYHHLFIRPDGTQVLFIWDKHASPTLDVTLPREGAEAVEYALDGSAADYEGFDGRRLGDIQLRPGEVRIFAITPL
jgi:hypothetical protein